jgi:hypothetical protein
VLVFDSSASVHYLISYKFSNRKSIETQGYLICTSGRTSINQIAECCDVLSLLYHSQTYKTRSLLSQYETPEKVTNERASEYDISIAFPFSAVAISKPQEK